MKAAETIKPVVIIPIYKTNLNIYEQISLRRSFATLADFPIALLVKKSDQQAIRIMLKKFLPNGSSFLWHVVDDHWLSSHGSYNQLMLNRQFYLHYQTYTHMLICQLDAYVFQDQLLHWCCQPFDYIGAPLYLPNSPHGLDHLYCVGVGGFSLRRIRPILQLLEENPVIFRSREFLELIQPFNMKARAILLAKYLCCYLLNGCRLVSPGNKLSFWIGVNEDVIFSRYLPRYRGGFRIPDADTALRFSIDKHVKAELASLRGSLPFAAHAWWTSLDNLSAWSPFIPELQNLGAS